MPEQLSFAGFDTVLLPKRPTDGVFFAIRPDANAAARIARLARHLRGGHGLTGSPLEAERLHVTLYPLGTYRGLPHGIVAAAGEAAADVAIPPFDVAFDRAASFAGGSRNLALVLLGDDGVAGLRMLQQALGAAMEKIGLRRPRQPRYTPHMTLLYDDRRLAEQTVETIRWTVHEFVLVRSLLGRARHVRLGGWRLRG
jgi:2'-5' RNA ligase